MVFDPGDDGLAAWARLDRATRREVLRLAQDGRPHPNPRVASAAFAWGRQVGGQPRRAWLPQLAFALVTGLVAAALLNLVVGPGDLARLVGLPLAGLVGAIAGLQLQRTRARRVARANQPPAVPPDPFARS
ncbi:MAG TPA: hypothetical protein VFD04_03105 [Actinomycetes bacterium]|jgi:hypothetical protein|nr:hypothetical protein [Actinomycetes bacterium]